jgi:Zn-dependent protease with chaperone function
VPHTHCPSLNNTGTLDPDPLYSVYHYSHPPLVQRLRAIQAAAKDHAGVQKKSN